MARRQAFLWLMIPVLLLSYWLGTHQIDADAIWHDEYWSMFDAGGVEARTVVDVWRGVAERNPWHVPGFFMLLNGWGHVSGWDPAALRFMAVLFGVITLAWLYRLGKDLISPAAGVFAALIFGTSALYVYYTHELRMYTILMGLTVFTVWVYLRIVLSRREPSRLAYVGLFLGALGLLYTHYYASIALVAIAIAHVLFVRKNRRWWKITGTLALAGLLFVPWIPVFLDGLGRMQEGPEEVASSFAIGETLANLITRFSNGVWLLFAIPALAALSLRRRGGILVWYFTLATAGIVMASMLVVQPGNLERTRYFASAWPFLGLLAGMGLYQITRWRGLPGRSGLIAALALTVVWVGLGVVRSSTDTSSDPSINVHVNPFQMHRIPRDLRGLSQPDDMIVVFANQQNMRPWIDTTNKGIGSVYFNGFPGEAFFPRLNNDPAIREVEQGWLLLNAEDRQRVWVASMPLSLAQQYPPFASALSESFAMCTPLVDTPEIRIDQFALSEVCCVDAARLSSFRLRFGDGIGLNNLGTDFDGDSLRVSALWSLAADVPLHVYSVSWQLWNDIGEKVGQADDGLLPQPYPCQQAEIPLTDLPPGDYRLMASVYAWETGDHLTAVDPASGASGTILPVATITLP